MRKITFLLGVGVGYVLGTAAGRQRFEQIKTTAAKTWGDPKVQDTVHTAQRSATAAAKSAGTQLKDAAVSSPAAKAAVDSVKDRLPSSTSGSSGDSSSTGAPSPAGPAKTGATGAASTGSTPGTTATTTPGVVTNPKR